MERHWDHYCRLSLVHFMAFPECASGDGPIVETLARVAEDEFFSAVEVGPIHDPATRREVASLIAQSHMRVASGAQPIILGGKLNLNSPDAAERARAVTRLQDAIAQAAEIGSQALVILSGPDPASPDQRGAATGWLADSILELGRCGDEHGVRVILETFDRDVDKKALVGPADEAAALAERVKADYPAFGLLYDMGHMPLLDESPAPALETLRDHLAHAHVGNCVKVPGRPAYGDLHPRFGFPGGENDVPELAEFLRALLSVGYFRDDVPDERKPWVGFEVKPQPGETSALIIASIKRAWRDAWVLV